MTRAEASYDRSLVVRSANTVAYSASQLLRWQGVRTQADWRSVEGAQRSQRCRGPSKT